MAAWRRRHADFCRGLAQLDVNDEADFDFLVRTIILGVLSLCVGIFLALPDQPRSQSDGVSDD